MKKSIPEFADDEQAERFVEAADLAEYDLSGFKPTRFEFQAKAAQLNMRLPQTLLDAVRATARARGIPYTRFVRESLEGVVAGSGHGPGSAPQSRGTTRQATVDVQEAEADATVGRTVQRRKTLRDAS